MQSFRLFVSSPGDVGPERERVRRVAERLNLRFRNVAAIEVVRWEDRWYSAHETFQRQIDDRLPAPDGCDLVVSVFWSRIGTELPDDFPERMPDGRPWPSGAVYELARAIAARRAGSALPDILVFRKTAEVELQVKLGEEGRIRLAREQQEKLAVFWREWFEAESGQFKLAFETFDTPDAFEARLETLLRRWLNERLAAEQVTWPIELLGSPFRGLEPFEAGHAAVFFGREREIDRGIDGLRAALAAGAPPFLLIVGASGAGKSSLARAGLLPRLVRPGGLEGEGAVRAAVMVPGGGESDPVLAFAEALFAAREDSDLPPALPELAAGDHATPAELADAIRGGRIARPVERALERVAAADAAARGRREPAPARLVLLIDQFERLFAAPAESRARFAAALEAMLATGRVIALATLRADAFAALIADPAFRRLEERGARLALAAPGPAELAEIVRAPAQAAGLVFERDPASGETLDRRLLADAGAADTLPLLQFALARLFRACVEKTPDNRVLSLAAWAELGGLEGAIGRVAAEALDAPPTLDAASRSALPRVLRALVEARRERGETVLIAREASFETVAADPPSRALVDRLVDARILVRGDAAGGASLRLAHEAALRAWPEAARTMADEQRFLELRDLVVAREAEWRATRAVRRGGWRRWLGHRRAIDASLLLPARYLPEARRMLKRYAGELDPAVVGYVRRSRRAQIGSQAAIILPLLVIALIGIGAAILIPAVDEEVQIIKDQNTDMLKKSSFGFSFVDGMLRAIGYELARSDGEGRRVIARVLADTRASLDRIGERFPDDDPAIRHGRHEFLGRLADLQLAAGDLAAADESASTLVRESRSVVRADDDAIYGARWALANALERLGDVRARSGDAAAALAAYDECLAIRSRNAARRLEEIDLTRRSLERTIAQTLHKMAPLQPAPERRRSLAELVAILERQALTRALDLDARLWLEQARKDLAAMP